jgi:lipopolysaccharide transport system permease protein
LLNQPEGLRAAPPAVPIAPVARAETAADADATPRTVIEPTRGLFSLGLRELWAYRELLLILAWRDVRVRYKQTVLGFGWAFIPPLLTMVVFSLIFGGIAKVPSAGLPYPLFSYSGILPWLFFASGVNRGASSLIASSGLVSKVYFPRVIVTIAAALTPLADLAFSIVILFGLMAWYGRAPGFTLLAVPAFIVLGFAASVAVSLWLAALNVKYRDVGFGIAFLLQFWMYASPVIYPVSSVPHAYRFVYGLNPTTGLVDGFRWALVGTPHPQFGLIGVSCAVVLVLLYGGLLYFKRTERTFVDIL